MERLTNSGTKEAKSDVTIKEILNKLAEYEDLEERLCKIYGECDGFLKTVVEHLERHENVDIPEPVFKARLLTDGEVDRWEEYKDLDKQGKLLKLPCAVGDTIYEIYSDNIKEHKVNEVSTHSIWIDNMYFDHADIGKNIFLTKDEAEAALKGMEGGRS